MPTTVEQQAYHALRKEILGGGFPAGEFLSQRKLAARSGASVISVRGALRTLENEGLIENVPQWGVRIPVDTPETIEDRYFMREVLEVAAVRRMAGKLDKIQIAQLKELARECDGIKGEDDAAVERFADAHMRLHLLIASCSGSALLEESLRRLKLRSLMALNAKRGWAQARDRSPRHHQDLIKILVAGDTPRAARAMARHVRRGLKHELQALAAMSE